MHITSEIIKLLNTCKCAIPNKKKELFALLEKSAQYDPLKKKVRELERELRNYKKKVDGVSIPNSRSTSVVSEVENRQSKAGRTESINSSRTFSVAAVEK